MKTAYIVISERGLHICRKICADIRGDIFTLEKLNAENTKAFSDMKTLVSGIFDNYDALVFFCSCGIAVRMIAPHIKSKLTDPAVIAVDTSGKFIIPLLSGHIGGANELARRIAAIIEAVPVITTATDSTGSFSPDMFAAKNDLFITDMQKCKEIAAASADGRYIDISGSYEIKNMPLYEENADRGYGIYIGDEYKDIYNTTLWLAPKNIIIGCGCKKDTDSLNFESFILSVLDESDINIARVKAVATIDIKKDENSINTFAEKYGTEKCFFNAEQLMNTDGDFEHSDFVMKTTGADNVCERSIAAAGGSIIVKKVSGNGMTCAVGKLPFFADYERR